MLEDFPKNHNLILIGQPALNTTLQLRPQLDLKSRITYSAKLDLLSHATLTGHIHQQLDLAGLPHATFGEDAINLINGVSSIRVKQVNGVSPHGLTSSPKM